MTSAPDVDGVPDADVESLPNYPISSVGNALKLLLLFANQDSVRIIDASRELGVARSTAHRLVQMLQQYDLVTQDTETRSYYAGAELIRMSLAVVRQLDIRTIARPSMQRLVDELNETVNIAELREDSVIFVDSLEARRSVRVSSRMGMRLPAHATASGKAILASLSKAEFEALYPREKLAVLTPVGISSRKQLVAELETVREQGFATNLGESEAEVHSVAVAINDSTGRVRAAIAVACPPSRLTIENAPSFAVELKVEAQKIGESLPV